MSQRHEMHKCEANRSIRTQARTTALPVLPVPRGRSNKGLRFIITANQHNSTRVQETSGDETPLPTTFPGTSLADSFASFFTGKISKLRLSLTSYPATSSPHSPSPYAAPPNFSVFTPASESEVYKIPYPTVQTSNLTQIRSPSGFLKNVHPFLFPQSPILSTFPSSPVSFIPLSKNPLSHHCLRNRHWVKKNSLETRICLSFPK